MLVAVIIRLIILKNFSQLHLTFTLLQSLSINVTSWSYKFKMNVTLIKPFPVAVEIVVCVKLHVPMMSNTDQMNICQMNLQFLKNRLILQHFFKKQMFLNYLEDISML